MTDYTSKTLRSLADELERSRDIDETNAPEEMRAHADAMEKLERWVGELEAGFRNKVSWAQQMMPFSSRRTG